MPCVLKVRRTDRPSEFVLVNSEQNGTAALDLKLVGTDGESPFVSIIRESEIQSLRSSNYHGTSDDWISTLSAIFLQQQADADVVQGLEAVATVSTKTINLSIRKNISGITQRLGAITLMLEEDEPIELFDWAGHAAQNADELRNQLIMIQKSMITQQSAVQTLTAELNALVKAKKDHEEDLLKKFAALLNTKKLKIRDQQRLLANAKLDPKAAAQVQQTRSAPVRRPGVSRASKRKANAEASETDEDEEYDLRGKVEDPLTPEKSDAETEDEDSDADGFAPAPAASQASRKITDDRGKGLGLGTQGATASTASPSMEEKATMEPPPRRELPFAKKMLVKPASQSTASSPTLASSAALASSTTPASSANPTSSATNPQAFGDDDETDSEDDEL